MKRYKYRKTFTFDGKRYNAYGDTEKEALQRMIQKKADLESGKVTVSGSMTVREWAEIALNTYKPNANDRTMLKTRQNIARTIYPSIGSMQIKSVKPVQCQAIINAQAGKSNSHIQKVTQDLRFIFRTAKHNKLILESPAEDIVIPKGTAGHRQSLSAAERSAFETVCKDTDRFMVFELMLYCGCRSEEATHCLGGDISVIDGIAMLHIRGTKTKNSNRTVPMPAALYARLKDIPPASPLAPDRNGHCRSRGSYNGAVQSLKYALNVAMGCKTYHRALVPPLPLRSSFVPYDLRHTYCTDLARRGVDIRVAQKLMGHSSIKITADIYTHVQTEQIIADAAQILGQ